VVAAIVALIFRNFVTNPNTPVQEKPRSKKSGANPEKSSYSRKLIYLTLAVFGLSGFTSLAYEVYWTKILTYFFKDSIYDLTIVLTAFLTGIVIGSIVCGKFIHKSKHPVFGLALVEILIGLFSLAGLFLISRFPYFINYLQTNTVLVDRFGEGFWTAGIMIRFGYAFLVIIIPTILFGATFPLVSRICAGDLKILGREIGLLNGVNTVGATLGSITAGFFFISLLGIQNSIIGMALLNIGAGLILTAAVPLDRKKLKFLILTATLVITLVAIVLLPGWNKVRMSTSFLEPNQPIEELLSLKYYREDAYGLTSVVELVPWKRKYLTTNRLYSHNSSDMMGLEDHRRLGHIPVMLHPRPQTALVIGLGAGISLRGVSDHDLKQIDCVELSGSVIEAARFFRAENDNVIDNPKVRFIVDDGRNYISTSNKKYDVIVGDILFPMSSGSSNIFSREYFSLCQKRLQPGGLICQWLPVHQLSMAEIKIIVKTFKTVFPNTSLWYGMIGESVPVIGCIGTEGKLAIDFQELQRKLGDASLVKKLEEVNLDNPYLFLSHFIMEGSAVDDFCRDVPVNTDDRPIIEFLAPKHAVQSHRLGVLNLLELNQVVEEVAPYLVNTGGEASRVKARIYRYAEGKKVIIEGYGLAVEGNTEGQSEKYQEAFEKDPENEDLMYCLKLCYNL
jgi:spermidine synthase